MIDQRSVCSLCKKPVDFLDTDSYDIHPFTKEAGHKICIIDFLDAVQQEEFEDRL